MMTALQWGMPALSIIFTAFMPAAAQLSFFVSSSLSYGQASLFRSPGFRTWVNMTPLPDKPSSTPSSTTLRMRPIPGSEGTTNAPKRFSLDGTLGNVMSGFQSAKESAKDLVKERQAKQDDASAKARAAAYEERRQKELFEETKRQNERRRLERARRKAEEEGKKKGRK